MHGADGSTTSVLERARKAYAAYRWDDAYHGFRAAENDSGLGADDLAAMADTAWWLGLNDESLALSERLFHHYMSCARTAEAARLAIETGFLWQLRGEPTVGSGWISRANRLLSDMHECVAHGYARYLEAVEALGRGDTVAAGQIARQLQELADRHVDRTLAAGGLVVEGTALVKHGQLDNGLALFDEAMLAVRAGTVRLTWAGNLYCQVLSLLIELADIRRARDWTGATERWCDEHNNPAMFVGICRLHRAQLAYLEGAWREAEQQAARSCNDLARMNVGVVAEAQYVLGELCRVKADAAGAHVAYERARELGRAPEPGASLLQLSQGDLKGARRSIQTALASSDQPLSRAPLLAAQVEIVAAAADVEAARAATEELTSIAETHRSPGLLAVARHAAGISRLSAGAPRLALPLLRDAHRRWRELDAPYEAARVRLALAQALERFGDDAAASRELSGARATLERLGAALPEPAQQMASGTDRALPAGLSGREAQVVACVAAGYTNRQIAAELTISERTVERHLSNIFGKLGVSSRTEAVAFAFEHGLASSPRQHSS